MIRRQTMEQFHIKNSMGLFDGVPFCVKFHWRVWEPIEATGSLVRFGRYVEYDSNDVKG